jgi:hypothetical protein
MFPVTPKLLKAVVEASGGELKEADTEGVLVHVMAGFAR